MFHPNDEPIIKDRLEPKGILGIPEYLYLPLIMTTAIGYLFFLVTFLFIAEEFADTREYDVYFALLFLSFPIIMSLLGVFWALIARMLRFQIPYLRKFLNFHSIFTFTYIAGWWVSLVIILPSIGSDYAGLNPFDGIVGIIYEIAMILSFIYLMLSLIVIPFWFISAIIVCGIIIFRHTEVLKGILTLISLFLLSLVPSLLAALWYFLTIA